MYTILMGNLFSLHIFEKIHLASFQDCVLFLTNIVLFFDLILTIVLDSTIALSDCPRGLDILLNAKQVLKENPISCIY